MKKKLILNICMVLTIIFVAVCAVCAVGSVKGWFGNEAASDMTITEKSGISMIERSGVAYEVNTGTAIRSEDKFYTKNSALLTIAKADENCIYLGENAEILITEAEEAICMEVLQGEALIDARNLEDVLIHSGNTQILMNQSVAAVSTQAGSSMVYVYAGEIEINGTESGEATKVASGKFATIAENSGEYGIKTLNANNLSDTQMIQLAKCGMDENFCFTEADLREVQTAREAEILEAKQEALKQKEEAAKKRTEEENKKASANGETANTTEGEAIEEPTSNDTLSEIPSDDVLYEEEYEEPVYEEEIEEESTMSCTIEIRCDTILDNMDNLTSGKETYVPSSGTILGTTSVEFSEGETVFDVLQRVCDITGIQIEYSWTPLYNSYYIEGINHLYEFDCGNESGWMYKVNGWFPNYGCSSYQLEDGDTIVWCYTCNGLGADVGG